ncbi:hypothetical protein [Mucilaginibacter segetis]|uniref:Uncharacterized protein n=1 Tax=Mucilaginibacter segetis TaxID=2793071 RepID=A0A934PTX9_9SPHI|nr:hypothetical protein [Mucilaginibacter segetis]MBK0379091.1 hypothetical protein [Mucilaginibacter segetis]
MSYLRQLLWYFYKPLFIWNLAFSLGYLEIIHIYGQKVISYGFFFKLLGYASTTYLQSYTAKNTYMYYRNAGYSIKRMYIYVYTIDIGIYIILLTLYLYYA